jgi:hypothetical protein
MSRAVQVGSIRQLGRVQPWTPVAVGGTPTGEDGGTLTGVATLIPRTSPVPHLLPQPFMLDAASLECELRTARLEAGAVRHQGYCRFMIAPPSTLPHWGGRLEW